MFPTAEVRWFFHGEIPAAIWDWFNHEEGQPETQPPRTDHYLRIAEGDSLGVKLREGRVEVKQRYGQQEITPLGKYAEGRVEQWRKWSFELAEPGDLVPSLGKNASGWIGVRKERTIQSYRVTDTQAVIAVDNQYGIEQGCTWEVAKVNISGGKKDTWWSIGFEAFGNQENLRDILFRVTDNFLSMKNTPRLKEENSFGYPRWLREQEY